MSLDDALLDEASALLTIRRLPGVGDRTAQALVATFGSGRASLEAPGRAFAGIAGEEARQARADGELRRRVQDGLDRCRALGIGVRCFGMAGYPEALVALHDPPAVVFLRGRASLLGRPAVAVVGARRASEAGRRMAARIGAALARAGVATVSGLAVGIDAAAHEGSLRAGGRTIAVLGSGPDVPSPRVNAPLFRTICDRGLVVSEFLPGEPALAHHFPRRNRIIAALARAVVVVEAAERSGALITVDHALDLGRDIFAVPGSVESPRSRGTNALIREGARILLEPGQLLEELALAPSTQGEGAESGLRPPQELGPEARRVWTALEAGPRHVDELGRDAGLEPGRALAVLSTMELEGWAIRSPGMRFARPPAGDRRPSPQGSR